MNKLLLALLTGSLVLANLTATDQKLTAAQVREARIARLAQATEDDAQGGARRRRSHSPSDAAEDNQTAPTETNSSASTEATEEAATEAEVSVSLRDAICAICRDKIDPKKETLLRASYSHAFHYECINPWWAQKPGSCPTCRARAETREDRLAREKKEAEEAAIEAQEENTRAQRLDAARDKNLLNTLIGTPNNSFLRRPYYHNDFTRRFERAIVDADTAQRNRIFPIMLINGIEKLMLDDLDEFISLLVAHGANLNSTCTMNETVFTPLYSLLDKAYRQLVNVWDRNLRKETAITLIKLFINYGYNVNSKFNEKTALRHVIENISRINASWIADFLKPFLTEDITEATLNDALLAAAQYHSPQAIKLLVEYGADVNYVSASSECPLLVALNHAPTIQELIDSHATVYIFERINRLDIVTTCHPEVLNILIHNGFGVNSYSTAVEDTAGWTPLHFIAHASTQAAIPKGILAQNLEILIAAGAKTITNAQGQNPLTLTNEHSPAAITRALRNAHETEKAAQERAAQKKAAADLKAKESTCSVM